MEYNFLLYVGREILFVQYDNYSQDSWGAERILQVPNPLCLSIYNRLAIRRAYDHGRRRLSAVTKSELIVLLLNYSWKNYMRGACLARIVSSGFKSMHRGLNTWAPWCRFHTIFTLRSEVGWSTWDNVSIKTRFDGFKAFLAYLHAHQ